MASMSKLVKECISWIRKCAASLITWKLWNKILVQISGVSIQPLTTIVTTWFSLNTAMLPKLLTPSTSTFKPLLKSRVWMQQVCSRKRSNNVTTRFLGCIDQTHLCKGWNCDVDFCFFLGLLRPETLKMNCCQISFSEIPVPTFWSLPDRGRISKWNLHKFPLNDLEIHQLEQACAWSIMRWWDAKMLALHEPSFKLCTQIMSKKICPRVFHDSLASLVASSGKPVWAKQVGKMVKQPSISQGAFKLQRNFNAKDGSKRYQNV